MVKRIPCRLAFVFSDSNDHASLEASAGRVPAQSVRGSITLGRAYVLSAGRGPTADPGLRPLCSEAKNTPGPCQALRDTDELGNTKKKGHRGEPGLTWSFSNTREISGAPRTDPWDFMEGEQVLGASATSLLGTGVIAVLWNQKPS